MISILILVNDTEYAEILGRRLAASGNRMEVSVAALPESAEDGEAFAEVHPRYDFVITDTNMNEYAETAFQGASIILLAEGADAAPCGTAGVRPDATSDGTMGGRMDAASGVARILAEKYGRVSSLVSLIKYKYAEKTGRSRISAELENADMKFIACFGLTGGCGASCIAIGVGRELAAYKGKRTLYVSMEALESDSLCLGGADKGLRNISDFLYLTLKGRSAEAALFLEGQLHCDTYGLERFFPSKGLNDLIRVSAAEREAFFKTIRDSGRFDVLILDLGSDLREEIRDVLSLCESLLIVERKDSVFSGKTVRNKELVLGAWGREHDKAVNISNAPYPELETGMYEDEGEVEAEGEERKPRRDPANILLWARGKQTQVSLDEEKPEGTVIEIGYDPAGFRRHDGITDFVLSNEFGIGISKAAESIIAAGA
ncbi:MAG: hypothetical protein LBL49_08470 [Clostridiales Family XIII bacterium]|nr:hypothetical protein [Clostridiales Family XIII bacterium]